VFLAARCARATNAQAAWAPVRTGRGKGGRSWTRPGMRHPALAVRGAHGARTRPAEISFGWIRPSEMKFGDR